MLMENCTLSSLFGEGRFTTPVVEKYPPPTECIPFKILLGIIEIIRNDCYAWDGTVHPSTHLLKLDFLSREVFHPLFERELKFYSPIFHVNNSTNGTKKRRPKIIGHKGSHSISIIIKSTGT